MTIENEFREYVKASFKIKLPPDQIEVMRNAYFLGAMSGAAAVLENSQTALKELDAYKDYLEKKVARLHS